MSTDVARFAPGGTSQPFTINVASGRLAVPDGEMVTYQHMFMPAYYDARLAAAWIEEAVRLTTDDAAIAALDVPTGSITHDTGAAQADYVYRCFNAIAQAYNALNCPWYTDPAARALYRTFVSGPPSGDNVDQMAVAQFQKDVAYKFGWYSNVYPWAQMPTDAALARDPNSAPYGSLVWSARATFNRFAGANARNPSQFVQLAGLYLDAIDGYVEDPRELSEPIDGRESIRNRAYTMGVPGGSYSYVRVDSNDEDPSLPRVSLQNPNVLGNNAVAMRFYHAVQFGGIAYGHLPWPPNGVRLTPEGVRATFDAYAFDWRYAAYDESLVGAPLRVCCPLREYLLWARHWAHAMSVRDPVQIVVACKMYTTVMNGQAVRLNYSFINDAMALDETLARDLHTPDANANVVFTAMTGVATLVSTAGPWGAVAGLVIGAAAAVGRVVNQAIDHLPAATRKRDDLGMFKPQIQRAALAGSIRSGMETPPTIAIAAPPGWSRPTMRGVGTSPAELSFGPGAVEYVEDASPSVLDLGIDSSSVQTRRMDNRGSGAASNAILPLALAAVLGYFVWRGSQK